MARVLIGNIRGPQGPQGDQGQTGATGTAATVSVGSVTTTAYGNQASVTNSGTENAAILDFVLPQGRPGEQTTKIDSLTIDSITEPATPFPTPSVGDNGSTLFGKISKWFSDMMTRVNNKLNTDHVANNLTTDTEGYALDARQGKVLKDSLSLIGTVYADNVTADGGALSMPAGSISITVTPGTYIIMFGGASHDSEKIIQMNINGGNPWEAPFISTYIPWNASQTMFTTHKNFPSTFATDTTLTLYYSAGWYHAEIFAVRII